MDKSEKFNNRSLIIPLTRGERVLVLYTEYASWDQIRDLSFIKDFDVCENPKLSDEKKYRDIKTEE